MSDKLVIQIDDSQGDPRCAILWKWGGSDAVVLMTRQQRKRLSRISVKYSLV